MAKIKPIKDPQVTDYNEIFNHARKLFREKRKQAGKKCTEENNVVLDKEEVILNDTKKKQILIESFKSQDNGTKKIKSYVYKGKKKPPPDESAPKKVDNYEHTRKPRKYKGRKNYSDHQKAEALAILDLNGGNAFKTSKEIGVPVTTLDYWKNGNGVYNEITNLREIKSNDLGEIMEDVAWSLAAAIPDKIPEASLKDTATSYGIIFDKIMLHKGKPTLITASQEMNDEQLMERLRSIAGRISQRPALPGPTGETGNTITPSGDRIQEVKG